MQLILHRSDGLVGHVQGSPLVAADSRLPHGLQPGTIVSYESEWRQYLTCARRLVDSDELPGKSAPWNAYVLWCFLLLRSEKCKPTTISSIISALAHFGHRCRFILPSTKYDGNPLLRRDINCMKREIAILYKARTGGKGTQYGVQQSTPLGFLSVALLLSAFRVVNETLFNSLKRRHRHHLACAVKQHTKAMRFGHFLHRKYTVQSFRKDAKGCYRLYTD